MSVSIKYKGAEIASANTDITKTLKTSGKYCEADIEVVNTQDGGITPSGNIDITSMAQVDVTNYATAQVVDADLIAENIKKDVNILGVVGSFEGGSATIHKGSYTPTSYKTTAISLPHNLNLTNGYIFYIEADDWDAVEQYQADNYKMLAMSSAFYYKANKYTVASQSTSNRILWFNTSNSIVVSSSSGLAVTKDVFQIRYAVPLKYNWWIIPLSELMEGS